MLKYKYKIAAILICLVFFSLALFSSAGFSWKNMKFSGNGIIADEIPHISGGYYYLKTHRYFLNPEHPPLVKDIAGLGEIFARPVFPVITDEENLPPDFHREEYPIKKAQFPKALEWANNQDYFGVLYLFNSQNNPDKIAFFARLAVILANTLLLFFLFYLLTKMWSERAALLGLFFFAVSEFSIAHGSFVVIDFMSAVLTVIAIVSFSLYLKAYAEEEKTTKYFWLTSVFFALALLSKFSSVVLVPAMFLGGLIFIWAQKWKWKDVGKYVWAYFSVALTAVFLISIFYAFHVYRMEDSALIQKINENYPEELLPQQGHDILAYMVRSNVVTKGLAEYTNGVFMVMGRMSAAYQSTYFMGDLYGREGAGGWYFPVLYLTKLPLGFHFFSLLALILVSYGIIRGKEKIKYRFHDFLANPLAFLLFVFAYCYMLVTFTSTFQIGLRHIMPVILAAGLLTGKAVNSFWELPINLSSRIKIRLKHIFLVVGSVMVCSLFCSFPYYLSYYNALGGGTENGYMIATDSNYDWGGSDIRRLAKWADDRDIKNIYTHIFADVPLKYYLGDSQKSFNLQDEGNTLPEGSFLAASVFEYMGNVYSKDVPPDRKYTVLQNDLIARVGKTIFIYRIR
jgi:hypothetical protein